MLLDQAMEGLVDLTVVSSLFLVPVRISSSMLLLVQGAVIVRYLIQWPQMVGRTGKFVCESHLILWNKTQ